MSTLDYAPIEGGRNRKWLWGIVVSAAISLFLLLPAGWYWQHISARRIFDDPQWLECESQMKAVGLGIELYAIEHHGDYPPSLDVLMDEGNVDRYQIGCSEDRQLIPGPPGRENTKSKLIVTKEYIYLGQGMSTLKDRDPKKVVVYEPLSNHQDGANFLFADGHTEYVRKDAAKMIRDLESGLNPPNP